MFEHLGEELILRVSIGQVSFRFDAVTIGMSWVVIFLLVIFALVLRRGLREDIEKKPTRVQAVLDALVNLLRRQLTGNFASERLAREFFPFISALFLFVLFCNWLSVIPYCKSPTKDLNVTLSLALLVLGVSQWKAFRMKGGKKYLKGFVEPYPFLLPLNIIGEVAKPISHSFRLFGNVFGGAILIAVISSGKITQLFLPAGLNAFYGLFIGAIQAFVFALLAVAYINVAVES
jgi:F-type H+-transporting ATPase subunit a